MGQQQNAVQQDNNNSSDDASNAVYMDTAIAVAHTFVSMSTEKSISRTTPSTGLANASIKLKSTIMSTLTTMDSVVSNTFVLGTAIVYDASAASAQAITTANIPGMYTSVNVSRQIPSMLPVNSPITIPPNGPITPPISTMLTEPGGSSMLEASSDMTPSDHSDSASTTYIVACFIMSFIIAGYY